VIDVVNTSRTTSARPSRFGSIVLRAQKKVDHSRRKTQGETRRPVNAKILTPLRRRGFLRAKQKGQAKLRGAGPQAGFITAVDGRFVDGHGEIGVA